MDEPALSDDRRATSRTLDRDLAFAHELADLARRHTLAGFGERVPVELKPDATPVTEADVAAERAIREAVSAAFADDGVLGEEGGLVPGTSGRLWIVDPIDGTKLYAEGIPLWTTLIALHVDGRVELGLADVAALGDRYHATHGGGAWRDGRRLHVSEVTSLANAFVAHSAIEEWIDGGDEVRLRRLAAAARATRGLGDAWAHLLVAQGSVDAYVEHEPCFEWDFAATGLIVEEAGGRLSTFGGEEPAAGRELLVTNGSLHEETIAALA